MKLSIVHKMTNTLFGLPIKKGVLVRSASALQAAKLTLKQSAHQPQQDIR